jgi:hypothetical protein
MPTPPAQPPPSSPLQNASPAAGIPHNTLRARITPESLLWFITVWPPLTVVHIILKLGSLQRVERLLARTPVIWRVDDANSSHTATEIGLAVQRARRFHLPDVKCLAAAATTTLLLRSLGVPAAMVIGVRQPPFEAHAWTEVQGDVVGESAEHVQRYAVIRRLDPPDGLRQRG